MLKQTLLNYMHNYHSDQFVKQWVEPLSIFSRQNGGESIFSPASLANSNSQINGELIQVIFPHKLFGQCFMMHARKDFENSINQCLGNHAKVEYVFDQNSAPRSLIIPEYKKADNQNTSPFSFTSFIASEDNHFALETAQGIARGNIGVNIFNPFCICGKTGCGKTHLLFALAQELRNQCNQTVFMSTPKELIDIYRDSRSNYLTRQKILIHQAFIIDDLHHVRNKTDIQDELVILFDHFYTQGKIVAFGINCLPEQLDGIIFPLLTRLQRGVSAVLKQPDLELRSIFIRKKAKSCLLPIDEKQVLALATQFTSLGRLEGIINRATALSYTQGKKISNRDFEKMIHEAGGISFSELTSAKVIDVCGENLNISTTDMLGSKRSKEISRARQIGMYLCRDLLGSSFPEIGNIFGGKDQSTAMYSVKKIEKLLKVDKDIYKLITNLRTKCLGLK